jgi:hypothetical protein
MTLIEEYELLWNLAREYEEETCEDLLCLHCVSDDNPYAQSLKQLYKSIIGGEE